MQRICSSLSSAGYDVTLIGRKRKYSAPLAEQPYKQVRLKLNIEKGKKFYFHLNRKLFYYLMKQDFDVVCAVDLDTILPCYWAAKLKKKKIVYDAHEYFTEVPELVNRNAVKRIWEMIEKVTVPRVDAAYTVSESIANLFTAKYKIDFDVIRNLPLKSDFIPKEPKEKYIIYQGALNEGRGIEALLLAMYNINSKLILAGEGDLSEDLRKMVKKMKLQDKVEFTGYLRPEKLKKMTENAFIGINLLENKGLSYFYSLSNKFFDYIQAGVPSVTINFPEYKLLSEKYNVVLLVEDLKAETISGAINKLLDDPQLYGKLQQNCLNAREELNWEQEEQKLLSIYKNL